MAEGNNTTEGRKLKRPVEELRAELMRDPDVREQARLLQISLEAYVEKILDYAQHPEKPAQIMVVPDEQLKQQDPTAPTVAEIQTHLEKIASGEVVISPAHVRDGFSDDRTHDRYQSALGTKEAQKGAPEVANSDPHKKPPAKA